MNCLYFVKRSPKVGRRHGKGAAILSAGLLALATGAQGQATTLYSNLHNFGSGSDGLSPTGTVAVDVQGDLFGTTMQGGANGRGTIWEISAGGVYTDLHDFGSGSDGENPYPGVTIDGAGNLYGTAWQGGVHNNGGMIWEIPAGGVYTDLHDFGSGSDGKTPYAGVTVDGSGNLYGAASQGGSHNSGMVWEIPAGGTYKGLYDFLGGSVDGVEPLGNVAVDTAGDIFGTTDAGGHNGEGVLWELPSGGKYTLLHQWGAGTDGRNAAGGVTIDSAGNLYGTTAAGGANNAGTVWERRAAPTVEFLDLHDFGGTVTNNDGLSGPDGTEPEDSVAIDKFGDLYGAATFGGPNGVGMAWEITAAPSRTYFDVHDFGGAGDGEFPGEYGSMTIDGAGNIYSVAQDGGAFGGGVAWEIPSWITSVTVNPTSVAGGTSVTGTVTLQGPAPATGLTVTLFTNTPNLISFPVATVTIPFGSTSANFTVNTAAYSSKYQAGIGAHYGAGNAFARLNVSGATLSSLSLNPTTVVGGQGSTGTVTLSSAAPAGGLSVSLLSSNSLVTVPSSVTVAGGQTTATFAISTTAHNSTYTVNIQARNGSSQVETQQLTVTGTTLSSFTLNPTSVAGGSTSTGTITLTSAAPPGGLTLTVTSNSSLVTVPSTVTVPAGQTSMTFTVKTTAHASTYTANIEVKNGSSQTITQTLTVTQ